MSIEIKLGRVVMFVVQFGALFRVIGQNLPCRLVCKVPLFHGVARHHQPKKVIYLFEGGFPKRGPIWQDLIQQMPHIALQPAAVQSGRI
jgi:hypothetical protein